jgi:hypothetical protein
MVINIKVMKNQQQNIDIMSLVIALAAVIVGTFTSSCKKSFTGEVQDTSTNRQFTPSNLRTGTVKDSAIITWNASLYALKGQTYTLDLSTDSLFGSVNYSVTVDTTKAVFVDPQIKLNTPYFTRLRANALGDRHASSYLYSTKSFRLNGQQFLRVVRDFEISQTTVLIHWFLNSQTTSLTNITFTPVTGAAITTSLGAANLASGQVLVTGLTAGTRYTVQLLAGAKSKGIISVATSENVSYTTTLSSGGNLSAAIAAASNGDVIGLNPGTYNLSAITYINQKTITIRSVSNNPNDTKILSREIDLNGDGAGLTLAGVEVNGNYSGTSFGSSFLVLIGSQAITNLAATFTNIKVDNCIIHDYTRCVFIGNNGVTANAQKIGSIVFNNSIFYNIDQPNTSGYYSFSIEKLQLNSFAITKSTLYNMGEGLINMGTALASPANLAAAPVFTLEYDTFNGFSGNAKYPFFDANANLVTFNFNNSIIANTPLSGTINSVAFRASNTQNALSFSNNNYFKLNVAPGGSVVSLTGLLQNNNIKIDLGWTAATKNFFLTPTATNAAIFSASSNGSTVGDPRWAY